VIRDQVPVDDVSQKRPTKAATERRDYSAKVNATPQT